MYFSLSTSKLGEKWLVVHIGHLSYHCTPLFYDLKFFIYKIKD